MTNEEIAERIKQARIERGMTQKDLAKFLNKTPSNVSDIERCRVQVSAIDLYLLSRALNKPIEYFFGEELGDREIEDTIAMLRSQSSEAAKESIKTIRIWLSMQMLQQDLAATNREITPEEEQQTISNLVAFLVQFEKIKQQVDAMKAVLVTGLKEQGIDLASLLGGS